MITSPTDMSTAWLHRLKEIVAHGEPVSPRGQKTLELTQPTLSVDMTRPALICPSRRPSYRFMAAEALWILTGDNTVKGIAPYNSRIEQFSDDGQTFFGAYGPHVTSQLPYVLRTLAGDQDTRQAWLRIWQDSPPPTKDVPCTLMLGWSIRDGKLNCHAYMRSSDIWLGIPYDVFNFSMISAYIVDQLGLLHGVDVELGALHLTAASSHLYERNYVAALETLGLQDIKPCCKLHTDFLPNVMMSLRHARASENAFEPESDEYLWNFWEPDE